MWQKLNRIDTFELKRARNQLINASQLVSAGPHSYLENSQNQQNQWLYWNDTSLSIDSVAFGKESQVSLSLDIDQFVISIVGEQDHVEHLVLSGITYPMAYGWMQVKMDAFKLDGELYNDSTSYELATYLAADEEMLVTDQRAFSSLVIYYSNAYRLLSQLKKEYDLLQDPYIDPVNLSLIISHADNGLGFGFSPGDEDYPEPYFFIDIGDDVEEARIQQLNAAGIWHHKGWRGLVLLASDFLTMEPEVEQQRVMDFFKLNHLKLVQN